MYNDGIDAEVAAACTYGSRVKHVSELAIMDYPVSGDAIAVIREANKINEDPYEHMFERVRRMER